MEYTTLNFTVAISISYCCGILSTFLFIFSCERKRMTNIAKDTLRVGRGPTLTQQIYPKLIS